MFTFVVLVLGIIGYFLLSAKLDRIEQVIKKDQFSRIPSQEELPASSAPSDTALAASMAQNVSVPSHSFPLEESDDTSANSDENSSTANVQKETPYTYESVDHMQDLEMERIVQEPSFIERGIAWIQVDWPMKVGGFLVILAVGWFVTYAADQGWISEFGRVILGYVFGIAVLGYGLTRAYTVPLQGNVFIIIGIAAMFISTLAGVSFPTVLMPEFLAVTIMLVTVLAVSQMSLHQKSLALNTSMLVFGAIVPLFFFEGMSVDSLFLYIFALTLGALSIVYQTGWRSLTALQLVIVWLYSIGHVAYYGSQGTQELVIALLFTVLFYVVNVGVIISTRKVVQIDLFVAGALGFLYWMWIEWFALERWEVAYILVGVLFFAAASYAIHVTTRIKAPAIIYGVVASALLVIATAKAFDGAVLSIALLLESSVATLLYVRFRRGSQQTSLGIISIIIGTGVPLLFALHHITEIFSFIDRRSRDGVVPISSTFEGYIGVALPDFFVLIVALLTFTIMAACVMNWIPKIKEQVSLGELFATVASILALFFVWLGTHLFMGSQDVATFVSLILYTLVGVALYVEGTKDHMQTFRIAGIILFAIVLVRIFFVEFWEMDMLVRIITFFIIGGLFISTAFMTHRLQNKK